jgi:hypothetical protein
VGYVTVYFEKGNSLLDFYKCTSMVITFKELQRLSIVKPWWLSKILPNFDDFLGGENLFLSSTCEVTYSLLDTKLHDIFCGNPRGDKPFECEVRCFERIYLMLVSCAMQVFPKELENIFVEKELLKILLRLYSFYACIVSA